MGKASSAKKVAKVAQAGKGSKVRSGQGQVFYLAIGVVAILGLALIIFARQSGNENRVAQPPTLTDHWHEAYGVYVCGKGFLPNITNQADPLGIHTHGDGLIHIHPVSSEATGSNAKLGVFFNATGIDMSDSKLALPEDLGTYETGYDCGDGKKADNLRVAVFDPASSTGDPTIYTSGFDNIRFTGQDQAYIIAVVPDDFDMKGLNSQLASIALLANPGDLTPTSVPGETTVPASTVPGATSLPGGTTVPGADTTAAPTTAAPAAATTAAP